MQAKRVTRWRILAPGATWRPSCRRTCWGRIRRFDLISALPDPFFVVCASPAGPAARWRYPVTAIRGRIGVAGRLYRLRYRDHLGELRDPISMAMARTQRSSAQMGTRPLHQSLNPGATSWPTRHQRPDRRQWHFSPRERFRSPNHLPLWPYSRATYLDYLQLGANRPSSVVPDLRIDRFRSRCHHPRDPSFEARFEHSYEAQSGKPSGDGSFGNFASLYCGTPLRQASCARARSNRPSPNSSSRAPWCSSDTRRRTTLAATQVMITPGAPFFPSRQRRDPVQDQCEFTCSSPSFCLRALRSGTSVPIAAESDFAQYAAHGRVSAFDSDGAMTTASAGGFANEHAARPGAAIPHAARGPVVLGPLVRRRRA